MGLAQSVREGAKIPDRVDTRIEHWLGVESGASPERIRSAHRALRAHIEARAAASCEPHFVAARQEEIRQLDAAVARQLSPPAEPEHSRRWTRIWAIGATLLALLLGVVALWPWRDVRGGEDATASPARLQVHAEPAGSQLEVTRSLDEQVVWRGPADARVLPLEAGVYALRVSRDDCPDPWRREVDLTANADRKLSARICQGEGRLVVRSNVRGDRVQIDGIDVGSTGEEAHAIGTGEHEVRVQKQGYGVWTGKVRVRPGEQLTLNAELAAEASAGQRAGPAAPTAAGGSAPAERPAETAAVEASPASLASEPAPATAGQESRAGFEHGVDEPVLRTGRGGSKSWHDAVRDRLLAAYDADASGKLDQPAEIDAISCGEWRSIESGYETGGLRVPMSRLYGFDGSEAPANTLGVTRSMRAYAYDRMKSCGLR